jgi:hypothetical protein
MSTNPSGRCTEHINTITRDIYYIDPEFFRMQYIRIRRMTATRTPRLGQLLSRKDVQLVFGLWEEASGPADLQEVS